MKKYYFIIAVMAVALLTACKKEEEKKTDPEQVVTIQDFVGEYNLSIDYIHTGSEGEDPSYGSWAGTMTIAALGKDSVKVTSSIEIKSGAFLDLYHTTGGLNADKKLVLNPNVYDNGVRQFDLTYKEIKYGEPLRFESEMYTEIESLPTTYQITNVARKK